MNEPSSLTSSLPSPLPSPAPSPLSTPAAPGVTPPHLLSCAPTRSPKSRPHHSSAYETARAMQAALSADALNPRTIQPDRIRAIAAWMQLERFKVTALLPKKRNHGKATSQPAQASPGAPLSNTSRPPSPLPPRPHAPPSFAEPTPADLAHLRSLDHHPAP